MHVHEHTHTHTPPHTRVTEYLLVPSLPRAESFSSSHCRNVSEAASLRAYRGGLALTENELAVGVGRLRGWEEGKELHLRGTGTLKCKGQEMKVRPIKLKQDLEDRPQPTLCSWQTF